MKWIIISLVAQQCLVSLAVAQTPTSTNSTCIRMTKRAEADIERMISKIGDFVTSLADAHYKYAITFVKFEIEYKNGDENEINVDVTINDCGEEQESGNNEEEDEEYEYVVEAEKSPDTMKNVQDENAKSQHNCENYKAEESKENARENPNEGVSKEPLGKVELMRLDLDGIPTPIMKRMDKRRGKSPLVVYIQQRSNNQTDYMFLNRK